MDQAKVMYLYCVVHSSHSQRNRGQARSQLPLQAQTSPQCHLQTLFLSPPLNPKTPLSENERHHKLRPIPEPLLL